MLCTLNPYLPAFRLSFSTSSSFRLLLPKKEGNGLSIPEFDIESIATPTTSATTKNCVCDLLDFFQWDPATAETQRHMNIEEAIANMKGGKEGTATRSHDCASSQEKEKTEKEQEN